MAVSTPATTGRAPTGARAPDTRPAVAPDRSRLDFKWILLTILIVVYALIPLLWILSLSLKAPAAVTDGKIIPTDPSFTNYKTIFTTGVFVRPLINSLGITIISTVIAVSLATLAAYAIARLTSRGKGLVLTSALAIAMFPPISIVGPLFNIWRNIGLY